MQSSTPCSVIGSKKIPKDPQLMVVIPILDEQEETCNKLSPKKGPGKKSMQLQCRNVVVKLDNYLDTDIIDRYIEYNEKFDRVVLAYFDLKICNWLRRF